MASAAVVSPPVLHSIPTSLERSKEPDNGIKLVARNISSAEGATVVKSTESSSCGTSLRKESNCVSSEDHTSHVTSDLHAQSPTRQKGTTAQKRKLELDTTQGVKSSKRRYYAPEVDVLQCSYSWTDQTRCQRQGHREVQRHPSRHKAHK